MEDIAEHSVQLPEEAEVTATIKVVTMVSEPVGEGERVVHYGGMKEREEAGRTTN